MKSLEGFRDQFKFDLEKNLFIGVERECHLLDRNGNIVPIAPEVLTGLTSCNGQFAYELSRCQLEWRTNPCKGVMSLRKELEDAEAILKRAEQRMKFKRSFYEVGPEDMPLDIYPTKRYRKITDGMSKRVLSAACRVIATHIHIGMPDHKTALQTYNNTLGYFDELCKMGDHSEGERFRIYQIMAPNYRSPFYEDWHEFYDKAVREDFTDDPRQCWTLIRLSKHGTIEFRMFGSTEDIDEIVKWASFCREICQ